jgi:hypothetical protein
MKSKYIKLIISMMILLLLFTGCGSNNDTSSNKIQEGSSEVPIEKEKTEEEIRKEIEAEVREEIRKEEEAKKAEKEKEVEKKRKANEVKKKEEIRKAEEKKKTESKKERDEQNKISIRANFNSASLEAGAFTLNTTISNTGKRTVKIRETAIRLVDVDGNIINPLPDRLAQVIEISPQSDGIVSTFFDEIETEFIATVEVMSRNNEVIASYDFDSTQVEYNENQSSMANLPAHVARTENGLVLWDFQFEKIDNVVYLTGVVENLSKEDIKMVTISFDLFDEAGYVVATSSDTIESISGTRKWKFKAPVFESGVYRADFKDLTSW